MAFRIAIGNELSRALALDLVPAADASYPASFLYDGPGWLGARFGGLDADPYIQIDLGGVAYGDGFGPGLTGVADFLAYSGSTPPSGTAIETDWTVGNAPAPAGTTVLRVIDDATATSADHGGNDKSLFVCGTDVGKPTTTARLLLTLKPSSTYKMAAWAQKIHTETGGDAGSVDVGDVTVSLYSKRSRKYLKADGTWTSVATALVTAGAYDAGATWYGINSGAGVSFVTESATDVMGDEVELELQLATTAKTTAGRFDDISIIPLVDLMMVANGHNITAAMAPVWRTSSDGSVFTTVGTFAPKRHQFWVLRDPVVARFHRFQMTGTPEEQLYLSDLILSLTTLLPHSPAAMSLAPAEAQTRLETPGKTRHISNRGPYAPRSLSFTLHMGDDDHFAAIFDALVVRSRGGAVPAVLFPSVGDGVLVREPTLGIYGDLVASWTFDRPADSVPYRQCHITIDEGAGFEIR